MTDSIVQRNRRMKQEKKNTRRATTNPDELMATEPKWNSAASGPHVAIYPMKTRNDNEDEDEGDSDNDSLLPRSNRTLSSSRWCRHLSGDIGSILLLLFLYLLQGIPLGLIASIPLVLQGRHVTYAQQAIFSFAYWPFSLKLCWAPIVDTCYLSRIGRRKSWLVPCQYLIGIFMLVLSRHVGAIIGDAENNVLPPNVFMLMLIFLPLNFLAATQDIAVDGWALTMLSRKNVGYASTCNAVGQTAGFFLGNVVFLSLESAEFCNSYLRSEPQSTGIVTLGGFVHFWGWIFLITTTLVFLFKHEVDYSLTPTTTTDTDIDNNDNLGVVDAYKLLYIILKLKPILLLVGILLTSKIAFAATDGITGLKLIEMGVPKDKLASMGLFLTPVQILLPWLIGKYTAGPKSLNIFVKAYPYRILMGIIFALLVWWTPSFRLANNTYPTSLYIVWILAYCCHQVATYCIFVAMMAFYAQISDPKVGGTYMTLLNTVNNLGGNWPITLVLSFVDRLTWRQCRDGNGEMSVNSYAHDQLFYFSQMGDCNTELTNSCTATVGNQCIVSIDGYYVLVIGCSIIGIIWLAVMRRRIYSLQDVPRRQWICYVR